MSGIGLGVMGMIGLLILLFAFGMQPADPPLEVMLIILSVVTAAAALQAAVMDYLVNVAAKILRRHPEQITILGPLVTYCFTLFAGTAHISYSILPIIAEVATKARVRPERDGSYRNPRELIWLFGVVFLCLMGEAFFGYLLPWGQMSYWGAQVIVNLFSAIPFIGPDVSEWLRGDYLISDATLNRFFAFHVIALPMVLLGLVVAHLIALHEVGSNNPDGVEIKQLKDKKTGIPLDGIPFHPYYTVKDMVGVAVFLIVFSAIIFFAPEMGGYFLEANNFVPANPMVTPAHIAPVWYFTPYYSVLRAIPPIFNSQFPGVAAMGLSVMVFALLPWLDKSPVKSIRYRGALYKGWLTAFVVSFIVLGYLGTVPSNVWGQFGGWLGNADRATVVARIFTAIYFAFFILMPWYTKKDKTLAVPERVTG